MRQHTAWWVEGPAHAPPRTLHDKGPADLCRPFVVPLAALPQGVRVAVQWLFCVTLSVAAIMVTAVPVQLLPDT
jgi:hypothetical protein